MLITGSTCLETFRQSGDSLAGRYYHHRLFPFTPEELFAIGQTYPLEYFLERGSFPEPFLAADTVEAQRWRRQYLDGLIREDIVTYETIGQLKAMNLLVDLLRSRVASPLSYQSLAEDLNVSPHTVKHYIDILEALYIIFRVYPYHHSIARSIKQQAKLYFFDIALVNGSPQRLENLVALSLYRHICFKGPPNGCSKLKAPTVLSMLICIIYMNVTIFQPHSLSQIFDKTLQLNYCPICSMILSTNHL